MRAAASEPAAAELIKRRMTHQLWGPLARELGVDDADLRVVMVGTQVIGLVLGRYVVGTEPLASLPDRDVIALLAPTLQRYLLGPL